MTTLEELLAAFPQNRINVEIKQSGETGMKAMKEVLRLLEQYHVTYIFVGSKEKEKYGDALNESLLQSIGDIVYQDTASGTYILQVQDT